MIGSATRPSVVVVGAGIVGLATARALVHQHRFSVTVLEAESEVGRHQTGNNSGVIHSGLYYRPGSLKAQTCSVGRALMYRFCADNGIPHERCGKLVLATRESELEPLHELERRGLANGLDGLVWLESEEIGEYEPHAVGIAGLWVPDTGIVDYGLVSRQLAANLLDSGVDLRTGHRVTSVISSSEGLSVETSQGALPCSYLVNCAGLYSDRVARQSGLEPSLRIIPFRGEYHLLSEASSHLVSNLIYPVPDPRFPFLGVHFTRTIDGPVEAGPNAVLALKREGYRWADFSARDVAEMLSYPGFWRVAGRYWRTGTEEIVRSLHRQSLVSALRRLVPEISAEDLTRHGAGVRAQAVEPDGSLADDFRVLQTAKMVHILNAPSPAATASLAIGDRVAQMVVEIAD